MDTRSEPSMDEAFLQKLEEVVFQNLSNEHFGINDLVKEVGLSRSQIHRKLKKINGKSITQFIRELRLEEAYTLLNGKVGTAAEIAYRVGFNSPTYFNKCFHEYFGITPGEVGKKAVNKTKKSEQQLKKNFRIWSWRSASVVSFTFVMIWIAFYLFNNTKSLEDVSRTKKTIAILPFTNSTGDSLLNYMEYAISELLINDLSRSEELTIINNQTIYEVIQNVESTRTSFISNDIIEDVVTRVKVESYIYGSYLLAGSTFRITLKLIDTKSSKVLETDYVEGEIDSIFSMVGTLSNKIKNYLEIVTIGKASAKEFRDYVTTNSPEAYRFYIQGMEAYWEGKLGSWNYFDKAIEIDSTFTDVYFFNSLSYSRVADVKGAKHLLLKANEGKDRLSKLMQLRLEAFSSLYFEKNPYEAINYFKQVAEIDPISRLNWYWLADNYFRVEKYEDALQSYEEILKLNKQLGPWKYHNFFIGLGSFYRHQEKYKKAQKLYKEALQYFPESRFIPWEQAICALLQNDTSSANYYISQFKSALTNLQIYPEPLIMAYVGRVYEGAGQIEKTEELWRLALEMRLNQGPDIDTINPGNNLYWYYDLLGIVLVDNNLNVEEGMGYLQKAMDLYKERFGSSHSSHPLKLSSFGYGYYKQGKYKEALYYLKMAEEESTEYDHTLYNRIKEVEKALAQQ
ncbi:MAG: helix-turn-helix domain-containing protein [Bacteroidales bacterium]|nr:helix-turn-helix domain-containing protein [Bacteroidales bacterium]